MVSKVITPWIFSWGLILFRLVGPNSAEDNLAAEQEAELQSIVGTGSNNDDVIAPLFGLEDKVTNH